MVGDVYIIERGSMIPADTLLLDSYSLMVDEFALNAETDLQPKEAVHQTNKIDNPNPFVFAKSLVVNGFGIGVVLAVGPNSRAGMNEEILLID